MGPLRRGAILLVAVALLSAGLAAGAAGETVQSDNLIVSIDGGISPTKLSRKTPEPIGLSVSGTIKTADGSRVPVLKTLSLQFDRHGQIYTKGLPTCSVGKLASTLTAQARKICGPALVGGGRVTAEVALPEQQPFDASGPLLIFNGKPRGGRPVLIFHVHADVPAPTTFVTTGMVNKSSGRFGTETLIKIPTIVAGQGSLIAFQANLKKTWTYRGRKRSLLTASCPTGSLLAHGVFAFSGDTTVAGNLAEPCTPTS
jgi:hypothetical protein